MNLTAGQSETKCQYCDNAVTLQQAEAQFTEVKNSKFGGTLLIAETAQEGGSYTEALSYYNKVIEQQPDFADAWLNKGICMVRTSKIGDLRIAEAISSWNAAIRFAKNPGAMKKRVATEINNTVSDFYPVLEDHYLRFHNLEDSLPEHGQRFLLLESALSLAMELSPTATIAKNGVSLCDRFVASIKAAASSNADDAGAKLFLEKDWKGALSSALTAGSKEKVASDLAATLQKTKIKYEQAGSKADPAFARQVQDKAQVEEAKAVKEKADTKVGAWGCAALICLFLGSAGVVAAFQGAVNAKTIIAFPLCLFGIWAAVRSFKLHLQSEKLGGGDLRGVVRHKDDGQFALHLKKVSPDKKIAVIQVLREMRPGMGLGEAKRCVEELPQVIVRSDDRKGLERASLKLGVLGADAQIEP